MPMTRAQKQETIAIANAKFKDAGITLVVHNNGLTVSEMSALRASMREAGADFKVVKNRLAKLATENTIYANIANLLTGPTVIATSQDPVLVAKGLVEFAKKNEKLVIIGGAYGEQLLDKKAIESLATLPSLDQIRAKIVGILQTPASRIASVLQAPGGQVARVIAAKSTKG